MAKTRYASVIEKVFHANHKTGSSEVSFTREDIIAAARDLGIAVPKNVGDVVYSFRYRQPLPDSVLAALPKGRSVWLIKGTGHGRYCFIARQTGQILPRDMLAAVKIPNATPGIISMYAQTDEQALLAKLRYNRLVDIFTGITCYSLQSHLRTAVADLGQVETDEVYVGTDQSGAHYVIPVQAKGGRDALSVVQIMQDFEMCRDKFPSLICRPVAAQFMEGDAIAMFDFVQSSHEVEIRSERHYRLVGPDELSPEEVASYRDSLPRAGRPAV